MDNSPVTNVIGRRLDELDRQIHTCLRDIRRNLKELEQVSGDDDTSQPAATSKPGAGQQFAALLKTAIEDREPTQPE